MNQCPLDVDPKEFTEAQSKIPLSIVLFLRWSAIAGQSITLLITTLYFHFPIPSKIVWSNIGVAIVVNLILTLTREKQRRIPTNQVIYYLLYDSGQLFCLIFATGGLNNPFLLFLLPSVVIAAGFLNRTHAMIIALATVAGISLLFFSPYPLPWEESGLFLPDRLRFVVWIALVIAVLFIFMYTSQVSKESSNLARALKATELALAREQRLASLAGLAAAAAHELGSPLTTITVTAKDLTLEKNLPPPIKKDLDLILEQTHRCRDLLQDLSRNFARKMEVPYENLPLSAALETTIQRIPVKTVDIVTKITGTAREPTIALSPEFLHGIGTIVDNATQFAKSQVTVTSHWDKNTVKITIKDDGDGYPEDLLKRLGNPYISRRRKDERSVHLGLGTFIAQTLLDQKGATVYFENDNGAKCTVSWPRNKIEVLHADTI